MKKNLFIIFIIMILMSGLSIAKTLKVDKSGKFLIYSDGTPFLYLGDTAWELFHRLDRDDAVMYLENRAEKGFSVIQAVVLAENNGLVEPNAYGDLPLIDLDPEKPNDKYFEHVDFIVNKAEELGMFVGMLPTWGDKIYSINPGAGPIVFNAKNAAAYGEYLGRRYKDKPIIWILGGDRNIANDEVLEIWRAMGKGLRKGDGGNHLITFHPRGESMSSFWLHNESWLDFNMYQSGHARRYNTVYRYAEQLSLLQPRKPFVDGEPAYEDIAIRFWEFAYVDENTPWHYTKEYQQDGFIVESAKYKYGFFTDYDVRVHAYWDLLSGACGYTYGNNAIWQMFTKGRAAAIPCLFDWKNSLDRSGADDIRYIKSLFVSRPFNKLVPDQSVIYGINNNDSTHVRAACAEDGSFFIVYLALGQSVRVNMAKISGEESTAWWFNPATGLSEKIGGFRNSGLQQFTPVKGLDKDWVLVVEKKGVFKLPPGK